MNFGRALPRDGKGLSGGSVHDIAPTKATDLGAVVRDTRARVGRSVAQLPQYVGEARVRWRAPAFAAQEPAQKICGPSVRQTRQLGAIQPDIIDGSLSVERGKLVEQSACFGLIRRGAGERRRITFEGRGDTWRAFVAQQIATVLGVAVAFILDPAEAASLRVGR